MTSDELIDGIESKNRIALSRAITMVENESDGFVEILDYAYRKKKTAIRIGITGPPGAGKSTLVNAMVQKLAEGKEIAVVAVDPTSPFSGGAILGDRIRMSELGTLPGVFIRSMASRGSLGGLAAATNNVLTLFEAFGVDYILVETIGVGQVEIDVARTCDTIALVLVPESGDGVQVMKAGLLEIADIIVINKADRDGAELLYRELNAMVHIAPKSWSIPVIKTVATKDEGVQELVATVVKHCNFLAEGGEIEKRRKKRIKSTLIDLIEDRVRKMVEKKISDEEIEHVVDLIYQGSLSPFGALGKLLDRG